MGACSWSASVITTFSKSEWIEVQKLLEVETDIKPIFEKHPHLMIFKFTNLKLNFVEYIIHIHNNALLDSWLQVKEVKEFIDLKNAEKESNRPPTAPSHRLRIEDQPDETDLLHTAYKWRNSKAIEILGYDKTNTDFGWAHFAVVFDSPFCCNLERFLLEIYWLILTYKLNFKRITS